MLTTLQSRITLRSKQVEAGRAGVPPHRFGEGFARPQRPNDSRWFGSILSGFCPGRADRKRGFLIALSPGSPCRNDHLRSKRITGHLPPGTHNPMVPGSIPGGPTSDSSLPRALQCPKTITPPCSGFDREANRDCRTPACRRRRTCWSWRRDTVGRRRSFRRPCPGGPCRQGGAKTSA